MRKTLIWLLLIVYCGVGYCATQTIEPGVTDIITPATAAGTFESGDTFLCYKAGIGVRECDYDDLPTGNSSGTLTTIQEEDSGVGGADIVTLDFEGDDFDLSESPDTEVNVTIAAAVTRDTEWDTVGEIETVTSVNILVETEIDASSELRAIMDDESGTGALLFAGGDIGAATATTPSADDDDTSVATTAYVQDELDARRFTSCRTLETPTDADDDIPVWIYDYAVTITDVHCQTEGGTSIAITLGDGTNSLEAVTCDADGAEDDGSITNGTFTDSEAIEWDCAAPSGTVDWVTVCISGTRTAD